LIPSRRQAQDLLLVLPQVHVEVPVGFEPVLVYLDRERADQSEGS